MKRVKIPEAELAELEAIARARVKTLQRMIPVLEKCLAENGDQQELRGLVDDYKVELKTFKRFLAAQMRKHRAEIEKAKADGE